MYTQLPPTGNANNTGLIPGDNEMMVVYENMETGQLIDQIQALRNAVRFLRSQNSYLKSYDLLSQIKSLPPIQPPELPPTPPPSEPSSPKGTPVQDIPPPRLEIPRSGSDRYRVLNSETRHLFKEAIKLSSMPQIVDLTKVKKNGGWMRSSDRPENQLRVQREKFKKLGKRVEILKQEIIGGGIPSSAFVSVGA